MLTCIICGEPITDKYSYHYHRNERHCAIKARYYREVRRWLERVKSDNIKNSLDYALLKEKVKIKIQSWKKTSLKIAGKEVTLNAIAKRKFYPKLLSKDSQLKPRPYIRKGKWKKHQQEAIINGTDKRRKGSTAERNRRKAEMPEG